MFARLEAPAWSIRAGGAAGCPSSPEATIFLSSFTVQHDTLRKYEISPVGGWWTTGGTDISERTLENRGQVVTPTGSGTPKTAH